MISKCEERAERSTEDLKEATTKADEAERRANALESRSRSDDEKIESLEEQLKVDILDEYSLFICANLKMLYSRAQFYLVYRIISSNVMF